jgi:uncharacterized caspase-like protein
MHHTVRLLLLVGATAALPLVAAAQSTPIGEILKLPPLELKAPPKVRAATAALGLGRQRLALVLVQSQIGGVPLPAAVRDGQAVAAALEKAGYVVMPRPDLGRDAVRAALKEFRSRLQPGGAGLIYVAGAAAQLDGQSLLLTRDLPAPASPTATAEPAALRAAGLPLTELLEALQITPPSLRLLVVDAAAPLPAVPAAQQGLATPAVPEGVMALLSATPGRAIALQPPAPLPQPTPTDPRALAGSAFGTAFVHALTTARSTGPDALRNARRLAIDGTGGAVAPWLGGRSDEEDELGEPGLIESVLPPTPEDAAARAVAKAAGLARNQIKARLQGDEPVRSPPPEASTAPPINPALPAATTGAVGAAAGVAGVVGAVAAQEQALQAEAVQTAVQAAVQAGTQVLATVAQAVTASTAGRETQGDKRDTDAPTAAAAPPGPAAPAAPPAPPAAPAAAPSAPPGLPPLNPYGYAAGDSFTYRRIDEWKGEVVGRVVQVIRQLMPDGEMQADGSQGEQALDAQGRTRSRSGPEGRSEFQPVEEFWWSKPQRGQSRDVEFKEFFQRPDARGERRWSGEVEVGRRTQIQTPAGRFDVLPMEGEGWYHEILQPGNVRRSVMWERTVWYSPELGHPVAIDIVERDASSRLLRKERLELLQAQTSRTVPAQ